MCQDRLNGDVTRVRRQDRLAGRIEGAQHRGGGAEEIACFSTSQLACAAIAHSTIDCALCRSNDAPAAERR